MRYAGLKKNDATNCAEGVCVSFWTQGCPHRCPQCHNPETWNPEAGIPLPADYKEQIISAISANGIQRNFSILGGEPLAPYNREMVADLISTVKETYPSIDIFLWTGYTIEELEKENKSCINTILSNIDYLIDGPFIQEQKDLTLFLRGSANQRVWKHTKEGWVKDERN
jgi:anaerobic ribonucleoside-triphosphate reductase activating protein